MEKIVTFFKLHAWMTYAPLAALLISMGIHVVYTALTKPKADFNQKAKR